MKSWSIVVFLTEVWWQWWGKSMYSPDSLSVDLLFFFPFSNFDLVFCFPFSPVPSHHTLSATPPSNVFLNLLCCFLNLSVSSSESCGHGEQILHSFLVAGFHVFESYHHDPYFLFFWLSSSSFWFFFFPPRCHVFLILWCSYCFCLDSFQLIFSEICWKLDTASCWKLYQPWVEQNCCFMILTYVHLYIPIWYLPLSQQRIFQFLKLALNSVFQQAGSFKLAASPSLMCVIFSFII